MITNKISFLLLLLFLLPACSSKEDSLYQAIQDRDIEKAKALIDAGTDINAKVYQGTPLIHDAVFSGNLNMVRLFIEKGADVNIKNRFGATTLHWAIFNGNIPGMEKIAEFLIDSHANLYAEGGVRGYSALPASVYEKQLKMVELLIRKGIEIDTVCSGCEGRTPLLLASYWNQMEIAEALLRAGANVNLKDESGKSALDLALDDMESVSRQDLINMPKDRNKNPMVHLLLKHGAKKGKDISEIKPPLLAGSNPKGLYPMKKIEINGWQIAYMDEGTGQPIFFVHGLSTDSKSFYQFYPVLIKAGYRVIGIDLLGYGESDKPETVYSIRVHCDTAIELIKKLGLKDVNLVGHSMGGAVAILMASKTPEFFRTLTLLTPGGLIEFLPSVINLFKDNYDNRFSKRYSMPAVARAYFRESVFQWNKAMEQFIQARIQNMQKPEWKKIQQTIKQTGISVVESGLEVLESAQKIQIPVLTLLGKYDMTVNSRVVRDNIQSKMKNWRVVILDRCGHMIQYEQPDKVIETVQSFIALPDGLRSQSR